MSMIEKNSRQMPKDPEIVSNKDYMDILYGYLQSISEYDIENNIRFIKKSNLNQQKLGELFNCTRQTISKKIKTFISQGLLIYKEQEKKYILPQLDRFKAFLIPKKTLDYLIYTFNENTINIYVYLGNLYFKKNNEENPCAFTITSLKAFCGNGIKSHNNNDPIKNILKTLETLGLIKYHIFTDNNLKTTYYLDKMWNMPTKIFT